MSDLTWLEAPNAGADGRRGFLGSVHDLLKTFPERYVATAIPFGANNEVTMLHVVAGLEGDDLVNFDASLIRNFEMLAASLLAELTPEERREAERAQTAGEIGALFGASNEELAVVVPSRMAGSAQEQISALFASEKSL